LATRLQLNERQEASAAEDQDEAEEVNPLELEVRAEGLLL
jgi:hypothetical protein